MNKIVNFGPIFIAICMIFRGTDVLFRKTMLGFFSPLEMITLEHLLASLVLLPFLPKFRILKDLTPFEILFLLLIGCGASVGGILAFTTAFKYMNPAVVILIQKLQPIFPIVLSVIILKEQLNKGFLIWAGIAIISAYTLTFGLAFPSLNNITFYGFLLSLSAAALWGSATVFGKHLLKKIDNGSLTKFRYFIGTTFSVILLLSFGDKLGTLSERLINLSNLSYIAYMSLLSGLAALFLFYKGLKTTHAHITSIIELLFPLTSVIIVWVVFGQKLSGVQIAAGVLLLIATLRISKFV